VQRTVYCVKLKKEAAGLAAPPYPGLLGQRIYEEISEEAWKGWLQYQTMLINENRLKLTSPEARDFLKKAMEAYLFSTTI
jgi:Fe-S cluster biosynthesis and repair protein YggX